MNKPRTILTICLIVLGTCFIAIHAQSGRRAPKAPTAPTPEATPEAKPSPKKTPDTKPTVSLILGIDSDSFYNIPLYFYDSVLQSCADRLNDAPSLALDVSGKAMNRGDAVKIAKSQKEANVAWLQLRVDQMASSSSNQYDNVYIEYTVFAPGTAKVVTSGHAYQRLGKTRGIISLPTSRGSSVYTEQLLKQAARDAADHIMDALHVLPVR